MAFIDGITRIFSFSCLNIFTFVNIVCTCGKFQTVPFSSLNICTFLSILCLLFAFFSLVFGNYCNVMFTFDAFILCSNFAYNVLFEWILRRMYTPQDKAQIL